ncbi:MAG: FAD-dependent oxidoreductase [Gammaproteobacteria bacterium]|nr:MAG: FAD-dependent oxidoreductase [Gammaproteobacteria bacterium]
MISSGQHLEPSDYDVVVIGSGIQGAGVAQICALNQLKVLLLEQFTVGSQTSSRSSKLIHGGLRYLENWQWGLVRECLRERKILLNIASDLVKLVPFYIPVYKETSRSPFIIRSGLSLYAVLGGLSSDCRFRKVPGSNWDQLQGLETDQLEAVYQYHDGQTDDLLLTRAVADSAVEYGAELMENTQFTGAQISDTRLQLQYQSGSTTRSCTTKLIVNASGPWINQVIQKITPSPPEQKISLVQGAHIVVDYPLNNKIFYLEAPQDKRAVFAMPWKGKSLVGTTETTYFGDPAQVKPFEDELVYLKSVFSKYFPVSKNSRVLESFAGLRVLPSEGENLFKKSRETHIAFDNKDNPRVISICGGKLTAYRHNAELIYKSIAGVLCESDHKDLSTKEIKLRKPSAYIYRHTL